MTLITYACALLLGAGYGALHDKKAIPKGEIVSGRVSLNGKPLPAGVITFVSVDGKITVSTLVDEEGKYEARVPVGEYKVGIAPVPLKEKDPKNPPKKAPPIPVKYGDPTTSGLTYKVVEGKQTWDIELKSL